MHHKFRHHHHLVRHTVYTVEFSTMLCLFAENHPHFCYAMLSPTVYQRESLNRDLYSRARETLTAVNGAAARKHNK